MESEADVQGLPDRHRRATEGGAGRMLEACGETTKGVGKMTTLMTSTTIPTTNQQTLIRVLKVWAERKQSAPGQIALAWLMAQAPWIVPIPGTTQMPHMIENAGATAVTFTPAELAELDQAVRAIEIRGARMPPLVQTWSDVEAPPRRT